MAAISVANGAAGVKQVPWPAAPTWGDLVLVLGVLLASVVLIVARDDDVAADQVRVEVDGVVLHELPLAEAQQLDVVGPLGLCTISIEPGRARVLAAPCRAQVCVRRGWLTAAGDVAACVPNRLLLRLRGRGAPRLDGVSR